MCKKAAKFALAIVAVLVLFDFLPQHAFADANDFTVTNFSADYYLSNADPQGQLHIVEKINVLFTDQNHGLLRSLSETYKNLPLNIHVNRVTSESGAPAQYTTYEQNGNEVLKIGDPSKTVTGAQEYTVDYTMQNVITFYGDHDELFWNVNGTDWMQEFSRVTATLHLPAGLHFVRQSVCYEGPQGTRDQNCQITQNNQGLTVSADPVEPRDTLTFVSAFPKGYFTPPNTWDYVMGYLPKAVEFLAPVVLIGGAGFLRWWLRGRDAKGAGVIVPQYEAPDGLTPLEAGTLIDFNVDNRDLTATIIDLAIRKYLRIVETEGRKMLVLNDRGFRLELLNKDWSQLNAWEAELMGGIFGVMGENPVVDLSYLAARLQTIAKSIKGGVEQSMVARGYFVSDPSKYLKVSFGGIAIVAFVSLWQFSSAWKSPIFWGVIVGGVVFGIFYHFLAARTSKGAVAYEHLLGLKMYLNVAEKERIKLMQSPDGRYAAWANAPLQTVELFEKLLPYAIALGVEEQWAKKFDNIYSSPPDWYVGNYASSNTGYLVGSLGVTFNAALATSFNPPHSAGGSGFGGGFAGGGGGGGGGGGW